MSNPTLSRFWTNFSLHWASCAFLRSDLLLSSVGAASPSSPVTSLFPFPRRFLRERISHTSTKSKSRSTMKRNKWRIDSVSHQWTCDNQFNTADAAYRFWSFHLWSNSPAVAPAGYFLCYSEHKWDHHHPNLRQQLQLRAKSIQTVELLTKSVHWKSKNRHFPPCKSFVLYMDS